MIRFVALWGFASLLIVFAICIDLSSACQQSPPVVPTQDAADAVAPSQTVDARSVVTCASACATMARFRCAQGLMLDCASSMCEVNADPRFRHYNLGCITAAQSALQVRGCGIDCTVEGGP
jgi:hypothetical protein